MATGGSDATEVSSINQSYLTSTDYRHFEKKFTQFFSSPGHLLPDLDTVVDWNVTLLLSTYPSSSNQCLLLFSCKLTHEHFVIAPPPTLDSLGHASHYHDNGCCKNSSRLTPAYIPELLWMDVTDETVRKEYLFQELGMTNTAARSIFTTAYVQLTIFTQSQQGGRQEQISQMSASQCYCLQVARRLTQRKATYQNPEGDKFMKQKVVPDKQMAGKTMDQNREGKKQPLSYGDTKGSKSAKKTTLQERTMTGVEAETSDSQPASSSLWVAGGIAVLAAAGLIWWMSGDKSEKKKYGTRKH